jgi:hypothetical protein
MSRSGKNLIGRREFVKKAGTGTVVGLGCLRFGLKKALAAAQVAGKPLLTERNVNHFISGKVANEAEFRQAGAEAKQDVKTFARTHFHLTPDQEQALDSLTPEQISTINHWIDVALEKHANVQVKFTVESAAMDHPTATREMGFLPAQAPTTHAGKPTKKTTMTSVSGSASGSVGGVTATVSISFSCKKTSTTS